jgi:KaiC/GvpD/RAD55 family RecA-like ATPase
MATESQLLASAARSREACERLNGSIKELLSPLGQTIYAQICGYYERDAEAKCTDFLILRELVSRTANSPKLQQRLSAALEEIESLEISPANIVKVQMALQREKAGAKLSALLASGTGTDDVRAQIESYIALLDAEEDKAEAEVVRGAPLADLIRVSYAPENLIKVAPKALNDRLDGGMLRGHHLVIYARPEAGKTLFTINMVAGFLRQGLTVLYVGNEEPVYDLVLRAVSRLTGMTKYEIIEAPERADTLAREKGYDNLIFAGGDTSSLADIARLLEEFKPDVLVVDQIRNISTPEDNFTRQLEKIAKAVRRIARRYNVLAVSVTQAGDSATGKSVLTMEDVDSSKTGVPAAMDVMLGLGATEEDIKLNRRYVSITKNKISGKREAFPVTIVPALSKVVSE